MTHLSCSPDGYKKNYDFLLFFQLLLSTGSILPGTMWPFLQCGQSRISRPVKRNIFSWMVSFLVSWNVLGSDQANTLNFNNSLAESRCFYSSEDPFGQQKECYKALEALLVLWFHYTKQRNVPVLYLRVFAVYLL